MFCKRIRMLWLVTLVGVLAAGCGLGEYEAEMKKQQEFLKKSEEENLLLGPPVFIALPAKGSSDKVEVDQQCHFRPPLGIASSRDANRKFLEDGKGNPTSIPCHYFVRDDKVKKEDCPVREVLIVSNRWEEMFPTGSGEKPHTFDLKKVLSCYEKNEKDSGDLITLNPPHRDSLIFDPFTAGRKNYTASIYVCYRGEIVRPGQRADEAAPMIFVIIFHADNGVTEITTKANDKVSINTLLETSLESFGAGPEAVKLHQAYHKMFPKAVASPPASSSSK